MIPLRTLILFSLEGLQLFSVRGGGLLVALLFYLDLPIFVGQWPSRHSPHKLNSPHAQCATAFIITVITCIFIYQSTIEKYKIF